MPSWDQGLECPNSSRPALACWVMLYNDWPSPRSHWRSRRAFQLQKNGAWLIPRPSLRSPWQARRSSRDLQSRTNPTPVRIEDFFYGLNQIDVDVITNPLAISNKDELGHLAAPLWGRLPAMNAKLGIAFPHRNTSPQLNHCVKSKWSNNDRPVFPI